MNTFIKYFYHTTNKYYYYFDLYHINTNIRFHKEIGNIFNDIQYDLVNNKNNVIQEEKTVIKPF